MNNYYEYLKSKPIYYSVIVYVFIFFIILWGFMGVYGYRYIAEYKAKDEKNIIKGCSFFGGVYKNKYNIDNYYIYIEGGGGV